MFDNYVTRVLKISIFAIGEDPAPKAPRGEEPWDPSVTKYRIKFQRRSLNVLKFLRSEG